MGNNFRTVYNDLKPILSFFAESSLYGISLALLLGFFLISGIILIAH